MSWADASALSRRDPNIATAADQPRWDVGCSVRASRIKQIAPINTWSLDKKVVQTGPASLAWMALTTGGCDAWLADPHAGALRIDAALVQCLDEFLLLPHDRVVFRGQCIDLPGSSTSSGR